MSRTAWLGLLLLSALWGAVYLLIELTLRELSPPVVVFGRVALAAAVLTPAALASGALQRLRRHPGRVVLTVLVQATAPLVLLTYGQTTVPSSLAGILVGAQPLFVALLALRFDPAERPRGRRGAFGIGLGLLGLVLLFGLDLSGGSAPVLGGMLLLLAAFCYAAGAILIHRWLAFAQPLGIATAAMLVSTLVLAVPAALTLPDQAPSTGALVALGVLGVVCTGLTLALFYTLIARAGPARAALAFYLSPGFAVALGALILREPVGASTFLGLAAVTAGSALAAGRAEERGRRPGASRS